MFYMCNELIEIPFMKSITSPSTSNPTLIDLDPTHAINRASTKRLSKSLLSLNGYVDHAMILSIKGFPIVVNFFPIL